MPTEIGVIFLCRMARKGPLGATGSASENNHLRLCIAGVPLAPPVQSGVARVPHLKRWLLFSLRTRGEQPALVVLTGRASGTQLWYDCGAAVVQSLFRSDHGFVVPKNRRSLCAPGL